ncbi:MAG: UTP--glucose-1-phosphate uridylyltransferase, partial [Parcubacteria group bacterium]|nr:UTP--glucose-1-phosphate uridylyltransferase [Parcubacteria group bacterium]
KPYDPSGNALGTREYSHTDLFSWIYYVENLVVGELSKTISGDMSVLDLGTCTGSSMFTKASLLGNHRINYVGIDKKRNLISIADRYAQNNGFDNISFINLDLTDKNWSQKALEFNQGHEFDIVTASHLLEHIDIDGSQAIEDWLDIAKYALIISVPFEDEISAISAHTNTFNAKRLHQLGLDIESKHKDKVIVSYSYVDSGILIVNKTIPLNCIQSLIMAANSYKYLLSMDQQKLRFEIAERLVYSSFADNNFAVSLMEIIIGKGINCKFAAAILKELLLQPMASSWWVIRNLEMKYGIVINVDELVKYYDIFQKNKFIQDIIRLNSSGSKVLAVARGVLLKKKTTTYYLDVQPTDTCPNRCKKCWRYYVNDKGKPALLPRKRNKLISRPSFEDYKRVFHEAIDMGVESIATTGGGEPFTFKLLPELFADAKAYAKIKGIKLRTFVPSSGLGGVYNDEEKLKLLISNLDLLRFSFDAFDREFIMDNHGISSKQYDEMIINLKQVVRVKREINASTDLEVLILLYKDSYHLAEKTVDIAKELGVTRILFNSITGNDDIQMTKFEMEDASKILRRIYERTGRGDFFPMQIDFDPALLGGYSDISELDKNNRERPLGNIRYCMKNIFGLTPVVTAEGVFHVCFPCSQPNIANVEDIFKIGNIMENSFKELVDRMRSEYRRIDPERDCIHDCRDIPYFNGILRKVIEDSLLGISPVHQPFIDKSQEGATTGHTLHEERYIEANVADAVNEIEEAASFVLKDKIEDFKVTISRIENYNIEIVWGRLPIYIAIEFISRYKSGNLFDIHVTKTKTERFIFSYELGLIYSLEKQNLLSFNEFIKNNKHQGNGKIISLVKELSTKLDNKEIFIADQQYRIQDSSITDSRSKKILIDGKNLISVQKITFYEKYINMNYFKFYRSMVKNINQRTKNRLVLIFEEIEDLLTNIKLTYKLEDDISEFISKKIAKMFAEEGFSVSVIKKEISSDVGHVYLKVVIGDNSYYFDARAGVFFRKDVGLLVSPEEDVNLHQELFMVYSDNLEIDSFSEFNEKLAKITKNVRLGFDSQDNGGTKKDMTGYIYHGGSGSESWNQTYCASGWYWVGEAPNGEWYIGDFYDTDKGNKKDDNGGIVRSLTDTVVFRVNTFNKNIDASDVSLRQSTTENEYSIKDDIYWKDIHVGVIETTLYKNDNTKIYFEGIRVFSVLSQGYFRGKGIASIALNKKVASVAKQFTVFEGQIHHPGILTVIKEELSLYYEVNVPSSWVVHNQFIFANIHAELKGQEKEVKLFSKRWFIQNIKFAKYVLRDKDNGGKELSDSDKIKTLENFYQNFRKNMNKTISGYTNDDQKLAGILREMNNAKIDISFSANTVFTIDTVFTVVATLLFLKKNDISKNAYLEIKYVIDEKFKEFVYIWRTELRVNLLAKHFENMSDNGGRRVGAIRLAGGSMISSDHDNLDHMIQSKILSTRSDGATSSSTIKYKAAATLLNNHYNTGKSGDIILERSQFGFNLFQALRDRKLEFVNEYFKEVVFIEGLADALESDVIMHPSRGRKQAYVDVVYFMSLAYIYDKLENEYQRKLVDVIIGAFKHEAKHNEIERQHTRSPPTIERIVDNQATAFRARELFKLIYVTNALNLDLETSVDSTREFLKKLTFNECKFISFIDGFRSLQPSDYFDYAQRLLDDSNRAINRILAQSFVMMILAHEDIESAIVKEALNLLKKRRAIDINKETGKPYLMYAFVRELLRRYQIIKNTGDTKKTNLKLSTYRDLDKWQMGGQTVTGDSVLMPLDGETTALPVSKDKAIKLINDREGIDPLIKEGIISRLAGDEKQIIISRDDLDIIGLPLVKESSLTKSAGGKGSRYAVKNYTDGEFGTNDQPKATYKILANDGTGRLGKASRSFLEIAIAQMVDANDNFKQKGLLPHANIPMGIYVSYLTEAGIKEELKRLGYVLDKDSTDHYIYPNDKNASSIRLIRLHNAMVFDAQTGDFLKHTAENESSLEDIYWPDAHDSAFVDFITSGKAYERVSRGYRYVFISNIDNRAAKVDPVLLGMMYLTGSALINEVDVKPEGQKGGAPAKFKKHTLPKKMDFGNLSGLLEGIEVDETKIFGYEELDRFFPNLKDVPDRFNKRPTLEEFDALVKRAQGSDPVAEEKITSILRYLNEREQENYGLIEPLDLDYNHFYQELKDKPGFRVPSKYTLRPSLDVGRSLEKELAALNAKQVELNTEDKELDEDDKNHQIYLESYIGHIKTYLSNIYIKTYQPLFNTGSYIQDVVEFTRRAFLGGKATDGEVTDFLKRFSDSSFNPEENARLKYKYIESVYRLKLQIWEKHKFIPATKSFTAFDPTNLAGQITWLVPTLFVNTRKQRFVPQKENLVNALTDRGLLKKYIIDKSIAINDVAEINPKEEHLKPALDAWLDKMKSEYKGKKVADIIGEEREGSESGLNKKIKSMRASHEKLGEVGFGRAPWDKDNGGVINFDAKANPIQPEKVHEVKVFYTDFSNEFGSILHKVFADNIGKGAALHSLIAIGQNMDEYKVFYSNNNLIEVAVIVKQIIVDTKKRISSKPENEYAEIKHFLAAWEQKFDVLLNNMNIKNRVEGRAKDNGGVISFGAKTDSIQPEKVLEILDFYKDFASEYREILYVLFAKQTGMRAALYSPVAIGQRDDYAAFYSNDNFIEVATIVNQIIVSTRKVMNRKTENEYTAIKYFLTMWKQKFDVILNDMNIKNRVEARTKDNGGSESNTSSISGEKDIEDYVLEAQSRISGNEGSFAFDSIVNNKLAVVTAKKISSGLFNMDNEKDKVIVNIEEELMISYIYNKFDESFISYLANGPPVYQTLNNKILLLSSQNLKTTDLLTYIYSEYVTTHNSQFTNKLSIKNIINIIKGSKIASPTPGILNNSLTIVFRGLRSILTSSVRMASVLINIIKGLKITSLTPEVLNNSLYLRRDKPSVAGWVSSNVLLIPEGLDIASPTPIVEALWNSLNIVFRGLRSILTSSVRMASIKINAAGDSFLTSPTGITSAALNISGLNLNINQVDNGGLLWKKQSGLYNFNIWLSQKMELSLHQQEEAKGLRISLLVQEEDGLKSKLIRILNTYLNAKQISLRLKQLLQKVMSQFTKSTISISARGFVADEETMDPTTPRLRRAGVRRWTMDVEDRGLVAETNDNGGISETVLVVDDHSSWRGIVRDILEVDGYEVIEAGHGIEALDILETEKIDAISLDLDMPAMDGIEFMGEAEVQYPNHKIVVMAHGVSVREHTQEEIGRHSNISGVFDKDNINHEKELFLQAIAEAIEDKLEDNGGEDKFKITRRNFLKIATAAIVSPQAFVKNLSAEEINYLADSNSGDEKSTKAFEWMMGQYKQTTGLFESYGDLGIADYSYNKALLYDQSVAIMNAVNNKDAFGKAKLDNLILKTIARQGIMGHWVESYEVDTGKEIDKRKLVGPNAWMANALLHYFKNSNSPVRWLALLSAMRVAFWIVGPKLKGMRFSVVFLLLSIEEAIKRFLQSLFLFDIPFGISIEEFDFQNMDEDSFGYGSITYGLTESGERYDIASTENNVDVLALLYNLGNITGNKFFYDRAKLIANFLVGKMWNGEYFFAGYEPGFVINHDLYLDPQTWTPLVLKLTQNITGINWHEYNTLEYIREEHEETVLYYKDKEYLELKGLPYMFTGINDESIDRIWFEGSSQYIVSDMELNGANADYLESIEAVQTKDGGIICAIGPKAYSWPINFRHPHIAATGWYLFAKAGFNPFSLEIIREDKDNGGNIQGLSEERNTRFAIRDTSRDNGGKPVDQEFNEQDLEVIADYSENIAREEASDALNQYLGLDFQSLDSEDESLIYNESVDALKDLVNRNPDAVLEVMDGSIDLVDADKELKKIYESAQIRQAAIIKNINSKGLSKRINDIIETLRNGFHHPKLSYRVAAFVLYVGLVTTISFLVMGQGAAMAGVSGVDQEAGDFIVKQSGDNYNQFIEKVLNEKDQDYIEAHRYKSLGIKTIELLKSIPIKKIVSFINPFAASTAFASDSSSEIHQAWQAYEENDSEEVFVHTQNLINDFAPYARDQAQGLIAYPDTGYNYDESGELIIDQDQNDDFWTEYWALNHVGTAHFIEGLMYIRLGDSQNAKEAFRMITGEDAIGEYEYAQMESENRDQDGNIIVSFIKLGEVAQKLIDSTDTIVYSEIDIPSLDINYLVEQMWESYSLFSGEDRPPLQYRKVEGYAKLIISLYGDKAKEQSQSLNDYPETGYDSMGNLIDQEKNQALWEKYWALNYVGSAYYVLGLIAEMVVHQGYDVAVEYYNVIIEEYKYGYMTLSVVVDGEERTFYNQLGKTAENRILQVENNLDFDPNGDGRITSQEMLDQANIQYDADNLEKAKMYLGSAIAFFEVEALRQSALITELPQTGFEMDIDGNYIVSNPDEREQMENDFWTNTWALNDISYAIFLYAIILEEEGDIETAREYYQYITEVLRYGQYKAFGADGTAYYQEILTAASDRLDYIDYGVDYGNYTSETLLKMAFDTYNQGQYIQAEKYLDKLIKLYEEIALNQADGLTKYPSTRRADFINNYWALNDVGTAFYLKGLLHLTAYYEFNNMDAAFARVKGDFRYAQALQIESDFPTAPLSSGFYWKVADAVKDVRIQSFFYQFIVKFGLKMIPEKELDFVMEYVNEEGHDYKYLFNASRFGLFSQNPDDRRFWFDLMLVMPKYFVVGFLAYNREIDGIEDYYYGQIFSTKLDRSISRVIPFSMPKTNENGRMILDGLNNSKTKNILDKDLTSNSGLLEDDTDSFYQVPVESNNQVKESIRSYSPRGPPLKSNIKAIFSNTKNNLRKLRPVLNRHLGALLFYTSTSIINPGIENQQKIAAAFADASRIEQVKPLKAESVFSKIYDYLVPSAAAATLKENVVDTVVIEQAAPSKATVKTKARVLPTEEDIAILEHEFSEISRELISYEKEYKTLTKITIPELTQKIDNNRSTEYKNPSFNLRPMFEEAVDDVLKLSRLNRRKAELERNVRDVNLKGHLIKEKVEKLKTLLKNSKDVRIASLEDDSAERYQELLEDSDKIYDQIDLALADLQILIKKVKKAMKDKKIVNRSELLTVYLTIANDITGLLGDLASSGQWNFGLGFGGKLGNVYNLYEVGSGILESTPDDIITGVMAYTAALDAFLDLIQIKTSSKLFDKTGGIIFQDQESFKKGLRKVIDANIKNKTPKVEINLGFVEVDLGIKFGGYLKYIPKPMIKISALFGALPIFKTEYGTFYFFSEMDVKNKKLIKSDPKPYMGIDQLGEGIQKFLKKLITMEFTEYSAVVIFSPRMKATWLKAMLNTEDYVNYYIERDGYTQKMYAHYIDEGRVELVSEVDVYYPKSEEHIRGFETETFLRKIGSWVSKDGVSRVQGLKDIKNAANYLYGLKNVGVAVDPVTGKVSIIEDIRQFGLAAKRFLPELSKGVMINGKMVDKGFWFTEKSGFELADKEALVDPATGKILIPGIKASNFDIAFAQGSEEQLEIDIYGNKEYAPFAIMRTFQGTVFLSPEDLTHKNRIVYTLEKPVTFDFGRRGTTELKAGTSISLLKDGGNLVFQGIIEFSNWAKQDSSIYGWTIDHNGIPHQLTLPPRGGVMRVIGETFNFENVIDVKFNTPKYGESDEEAPTVKESFISKLGFEIPLGSYSARMGTNSKYEYDNDGIPTGQAKTGLLKVIFPTTNTFDLPTDFVEVTETFKIWRMGIQAKYLLVPDGNGRLVYKRFVLPKFYQVDGEATYEKPTDEEKVAKANWRKFGVKIPLITFGKKLDKDLYDENGRIKGWEVKNSIVEQLLSAYPDQGYSSEEISLTITGLDGQIQEKRDITVDGELFIPGPKAKDVTRRYLPELGIVHFLAGDRMPIDLNTKLLNRASVVEYMTDKEMTDLGIKVETSGEEETPGEYEGWLYIEVDVDGKKRKAYIANKKAKTLIIAPKDLQEVLSLEKTPEYPAVVQMGDKAIDLA